MTNGYSFYVGGEPGRWVGRLYRDANDEHLHSSEGAPNLTTIFREAQEAIVRDLIRADSPPRPESEGGTC